MTALAVAVALTARAQSAASTLPVERIRLPAGFAIVVYTAEVPGARSLALGPPGVVFVGTREQGKVYVVVDDNGDGKVDRVLTLASGFNEPNGVAWRDGSLFVAEISRILRFDGIEEWLATPGASPPVPVVVYDSFPKDTWHGWKFIRFGPDGKLYVPVGAPCNVCVVSDPYAAILRMNPDGSGLEVFARGVRNTVGFDWDPVTHDLWFTDNGRDMMGDNKPPDELNHAPRKGMHFGFPYCHGGDIPDPEFANAHPCSDFTPPAMKLGPHVASLGMRFHTGKAFPAEWRRRIFIAEHGSWNRTVPIGYRVTTAKLEGDRAVAYEPFAEGWLGADGTAWERPVDIEVLPDGTLLVSDDRAGRSTASS